MLYGTANYLLVTGDPQVGVDEHRGSWGKAFDIITKEQRNGFSDK